jgi:hypothetical protein
MDQSSKDAGTIAALMKRFQTYRLPRMQRMHEKVQSGELLSDEDIAFLERVQADSKNNYELVKRNPSYESLVSKALGLYTDIIQQGLENEKNRS